MEKNFLSLIKTHRSVRAYESEPVPSKALDAVLEAGTYAPTGGGHQSPTIIAITDPKYRREIAKLNAEVMGSNTDPYYGAPVVILVLADGSASTFVEDGSCVLENMMLAAHALGLGTVWVHREREIFDSESGKALLREWKLPETLRGVGAVALGYWGHWPSSSFRRSFWDYLRRRKPCAPLEYPLCGLWRPDPLFCDPPRPDRRRSLH